MNNLAESLIDQYLESETNLQEGLTQSQMRKLDNASGEYGNRTGFMVWDGEVTADFTGKKDATSFFNDAKELGFKPKLSGRRVVIKK